MKALYRRILLFFLITLTLVSCRQPSQRGGNAEGYQSEAYRVVVDNITSMSEKFWDKSAYLEIKDNQIPNLRSESERTAATNLLETEYSKSLVRDAKDVLNNGCSKKNSHKILNSMMVELKSYPDVPGLSEVKTLKAKHDEADRFIRNAVERQMNVTHNTSYDTSYETKKMKQAGVYLNDPKIKCASLKRQLQNLTKSAAYSKRRLWHSQDVVGSYLQSVDPAASELNDAKYNLSYKENQDSLRAWKAIMDEHYEELNKVDENENL